MAKRTVLRNESIFEGVLFGISTTLKDYHLSWMLNNELKIDLKKLEDISISNRKKNKTTFFSIYKYVDEINKWVMHVVSNKYLGEYLVTEIKQSDFFLIINGEISKEQTAVLFESLKKIDSLQLVVQLDFNKIKSNQNLIFE